MAGAILSLLLLAARRILVFRPTFSKVACIPVMVAASQVIGQTLVLSNRRLKTNESSSIDGMQALVRGVWGTASAPSTVQGLLMVSMGLDALEGAETNVFSSSVLSLTQCITSTASLPTRQLFCPF